MNRRLGFVAVERSVDVGTRTKTLLVDNYGENGGKEHVIRRGMSPVREHRCFLVNWFCKINGVLTSSGHVSRISRELYRSTVDNFEKGVTNNVSCISVKQTNVETKKQSISSIGARVSKVTISNVHISSDTFDGARFCGQNKDPPRNTLERFEAPEPSRIARVAN